MNGFPKTVETVEDILLLQELYPVELKAYLNSLVNSTKIWVITNELENGDSYLEDDTHRLYTEDDMESGAKRYYQQELVTDANAKLFTFGLSEEQLRELFTKLG